MLDGIEDPLDDFMAGIEDALMAGIEDPDFMGFVPEPALGQGQGQTEGLLHGPFEHRHNSGLRCHTNYSNWMFIEEGHWDADKDGPKPTRASQWEVIGGQRRKGWWVEMESGHIVTGPGP